MSVIFTSLGSTYNRGDFTVGNAFFLSSLDLSPYAGALGRTPHLIRILDNVGKKATGYIGAVGAGETLGSDLLSGWNLTVGWSKKADTTINDANTFTNGATGAGWVYISTLLTISGLYKGSYDGTPSSGADHRIRDDTLAVIYVEDGATSYFTAVSGYWLVHYTAVNGSTLDIITQEVRRVTDPPSTAVHIVSSLNGTIRNWESIESGFNPNNIASWSVETILGVGGGAGGPRRWKVESIPDGKDVRRRKVLVPTIKEEYDWELSRKDPMIMTQKEYEKWRRQNKRT